MKRLRTATLAAALLLCSFASTASATTITPSTTSDDITNNGNCTLREAVQAANTDTAVDQCPAGMGGDVIQLGTGTYKLDGASQENANQSGDLDVTQPLTIQGQGAGVTTIDAQSNDRAIDVLAGATTEIKSLTITNGAAPTTGTIATGGAGENGGAVRAQFVLTLTDVSITDSHAGDGRTAVLAVSSGNRGGDGGAVWSDWPLVITGGSFDNDHAGNGSGGDSGSNGTSGNNGNPGHDGGPGGSGGAIAVASGAHLTVTGSTFSGDSAGAGGNGGNGGTGGSGADGGKAGNGAAGGDGGAIATTGPTSLTSITTSNSAAGAGGGAGSGGQGSGGPPTYGQSGNGGAGGSGGAVKGGPGDLGVTGSTLAGASAGVGGRSDAHVIVGIPGFAGSGGNGGAISGTNVSVDRTGISDAHAGTGGTGAATGGSIMLSPAGAGGSGGGIDASSATLTETTISNTTAGAGGGGGRDSGGINVAGSGGAGGGGGGLHATGNVSLSGVTIDHDAAGGGGNGGTAGFSGSHANGGNGGAGGGVFAESGGSISNTTLDADRAGAGGPGEEAGAGGNGGDAGGLRAAGGSLTLSHVTIAGGAPGGAGPGVPAGSAGSTGGVFGPAAVGDSAVAGNTAPQCAGTTNGTGNVSFPDSSCGGVNGDPKLEALADNGGSTKTMLLGAGSAAIDTVATGGSDCAGTDQRGVARPQGPACDSGAVEAANPALAASGADFGVVSQGGTATQTITVHTTLDPLTPQASLSSPEYSFVSDGCSGVAFAPTTTCSVQVKFAAPATLGPHPATLHLTHDAAGPPLDVSLTATVVDTAPPLISGLTLAHKTFAVGKRKPPKGTTIRFTLSEAASVKFTVTRKLPGRRKRKRCVTPTKKLRHAKLCTRTVTLGSFIRSAGAGRSNIPFSGRLGGRKLKPGSYTLTLAPTDASGNHGVPRSVGFKII